MHIAERRLHPDLAQGAGEISAQDFFDVGVRVFAADQAFGQIEHALGVVQAINFSANFSADGLVGLVTGLIGLVHSLVGLVLGLVGLVRSLISLVHSLVALVHGLVALVAGQHLSFQGRRQLVVAVEINVAAYAYVLHAH